MYLIIWAKLIQTLKKKKKNSQKIGTKIFSCFIVVYLISVTLSFLNGLNFSLKSDVGIVTVYHEELSSLTSWIIRMTSDTTLMNSSIVINTTSDWLRQSYSCAVIQYSCLISVSPCSLFFSFNSVQVVVLCWGNSDNWERETHLTVVCLSLPAPDLSITLADDWCPFQVLSFQIT